MRQILVQGAEVIDPQPRFPEKVPADRKVRVLAVVHGWFPYLAAGSERMMQHLLSALPEDEFEVEILSFGFGEKDSTLEAEYEYQGMHVTRGFNPPFKPDLVILHHEFAARWVQALAEDYPQAAVVVVHHNERYGIPELKAVNADLNVFNTTWVKQSLNMSGIVVHPPLEPERHRVEETGSKVTLVNLSPDKGVNVFLRVAEKMPDVQFLGVTGSHGPQIPNADGFPNVEIRPTTQDMREIWAQTRVVLMPSVYESWGMVASEASLNGIPVICTPTDGLVENLGYAGLYQDRDDILGYVQAIRGVLDNYDTYSNNARTRGQELVDQTEKDLRKFVTRVRRLVR